MCYRKRSLFNGEQIALELDFPKIQSRSYLTQPALANLPFVELESRLSSSGTAQRCLKSHYKSLIRDAGTANLHSQDSNRSGLKLHHKIQKLHLHSQRRNLHLLNSSCRKGALTQNTYHPT